MLIVWEVGSSCKNLRSILLAITAELYKIWVLGVRCTVYLKGNFFIFFLAMVTSVKYVNKNYKTSEFVTENIYGIIIEYQA